ARRRRQAARRLQARGLCRGIWKLGMDAETLAAYDRASAMFAEDWHNQPPPDDIHSAVERYFRPGPTADIGCGSGREVAWLSASGFPCVGYDASEALLREARRRYPALNFLVSSLPELANIRNGSLENVLCETVIMHLPRADITHSVRRLAELLHPNGTL